MISDKSPREILESLLAVSVKDTIVRSALRLTLRTKWENDPAGDPPGWINEESGAVSDSIASICFSNAAVRFVI